MTLLDSRLNWFKRLILGAAPAAATVSTHRIERAFYFVPAQRLWCSASDNRAQRTNGQPWMVPGAGFEPACPVQGPRILSPLRLPISPSGRTRRGHRGTTAQEVWRRDPESNRTRRICNPLHNRFAIAPGAYRVVRWYQERRSKKKGKPRLPFLLNKEADFLASSIWSGKRGSNSRPQPWQGCALPTELFPRGLHISRPAIRPRVASHYRALFQPFEVQTRSVR